MWNYVELCSDTSPMAEILRNCRCKENLRLVVYNLSENHVECATVSPREVESLTLTSDVAREIADDAEFSHAVLAFDTHSNNVFLVDSAPELPVVSAILLCVVTELLNGRVEPRTCDCDDRSNLFEGAKRECCKAIDRLVKRDERGRFVRNDMYDEPCNETLVRNEPMVAQHRFRIGRH